jgi:hypothetical protein
MPFVGGSSAALEVALGFTGAYVFWLVVFERWVEPAMRRAAGVAFAGAIDWHRSTGPFRTWCLRGLASMKRHAAVGLVGHSLVLAAALAPAVAVGLLASAHACDEIVGACVYLMTIPMTAIFALRVLWHRGEMD